MGQRMHPYPRSSRTAAGGFTLLELIITMVIAVVLMGVAFPAMREFSVRSTVSSNTNNVVASLALARSEAVKRGRNISVISAGGDWSDGWTVQVTDSGEVLREYGAVVDEYRVLGVATGAGAESDRVIFTATGALSVATGYDFSVCRPTFAAGSAQSRRIIVTATGSVRSRRDTSGAPAGSCS